MFKEDVIGVLKEHLDVSEKKLESWIEVPPEPAMGDYALPCFALAEEMGKGAQDISKELAEKIELDDPIKKVAVSGPYLNFFIQKRERAERVITRIADDEFFEETGEEKIMIEYPAPNTNKPLHLGHVRNMVLGSSVANMLEKAGNDVIEVNLNNDRGIHICKSMLAYQRWGEGKEPDKKPDHFVGDWYVRFAKEAKKDDTLGEDVREMLQRWEEGDEEVRKLWKKMNEWALEGFRETYEKYGVSFDKEYNESDIYLKGKDLIEDNMDKLEEDETGAVIAPLEEEYGVQNKVVLRSDGTSIYATQDIGLTKQKIEDYNPDRQIWVVASEQNLYFKQLFAILDLLDIGNKDSFHHLSYGMVHLPEGRMKSREGNVVDADDLLEEMEELAADAIKERRKDWTERKIDEVKRKVALAAIRFHIAKYDPAKDFIFNPEESISFEGDTGPYLQYTHARICSILRKSSVHPKEADYTLLKEDEEQELLRKMEKFPDAFNQSVSNCKPSSVANHLLEIGRAFNTFYHECPVLDAGDDVRAARLHLISAARDVIEQGLNLLGIEAPEEM